MASEIERKFLVTDPERVPEPTGSDSIEQGYLAIDGETEVRVRRRGGSYTLTAKRGSGISRDEAEVELDPADFERLWVLTTGRRVAKRRDLVELESGLTAEVDTYTGRLEGLVVVEVEFESEEASREFVPPAWFGEELTGNGRYANQSLAIHGSPRQAQDDGR